MKRFLENFLYDLVSVVPMLIGILIEIMLLVGAVILFGGHE